MSNILVVDDEVGIRELLRDILNDEGHQVRLAENAEAARMARGHERPDLVLLDIWMPDTDGITLLKEWAANGQLTMPVVMMSGHGTIDTAVEATKIGAYDFLEKPIALQKLLHTVGRALKRAEAAGKPHAGLSALGKSRVIGELQARLQQLDKTRGALLLVGERGSPFELAARALHAPDTPWEAPEEVAWLAENPLDLLQSAKGGTLFLREIGQLSKIEQRGLALLCSRLEKFDARLVCASSQHLPHLIVEGQFDADLFQAVSSITVSLPALREHREDIPEIAKQFLRQLIEAKLAKPKDFSMAALNALRTHDWPGNLAELQNAIRTLALTALHEEIGVDEVKRVFTQFEQFAPASAGAGVSLDLPLREARDIFEKQYFEHHIEKAAGNMSRVADAVGLERTHLYRKLKQLEIKLSRKSE
ncbi:MAG: sigma-54-dependent Fis family transcriptional regulator [Hydrogenophilales bacterium]|nr:sigma-54-dependent Fis family transcriptional regulator [Hydrogenophilales bacterium]